MRSQNLFLEDTPNDFPRLARLFEMAKQDFWNESAVIDWDREISLPEPMRTPLAQILSIVYYGERAALEVSAQLVSMVDDEEAKFVLAAQAMEEAKHISVFRRLLERLDKVHPANFWSKRLLKDLVSSKDRVAKMIGMQLIIENFATQLFKHLRAAIPDPQVCEVLQYVERDEKKHTGLAAIYLPKVLAEVPSYRLPFLKMRQAYWSVCLEQVVWAHREQAEILGIDLHGAMIKGIRSQQKIVASMGTRRGIWRNEWLEKISLDKFSSFRNRRSRK